MVRRLTHKRWSASLLWKPIPSTKKVAGSKSQKKKVNPQTVDPETGRVKLSVRRIPSLNLDNVSTQSTSETEKPRRNLRKVSSHPADSVQEHPQNELEKVKRSLRKVHNPNTEGTIQSEADSEKPKYGLEKVLSFSDQNTAEENISDSGEKIKKGTTVTVSKLPDIEATLEPPVVSEAIDLLCDDQTAIESQPPENSGKHEGIPVTNGELRSREDITVNESQKSARTASSAAKQERTKNGVQNRPAVPSYMAATESAKAKLKAQGSPRLDQDGIENQNLSRRHSLPASTNKKTNSPSPRAQRPIQSGGKGGNKSDRSMLSSRDGNGKKWKNSNLNFFFLIFFIFPCTILKKPSKLGPRGGVAKKPAYKPPEPNNRFFRKCYNCGSNRHRASDCHKQKKSYKTKPRAHMADLQVHSHEEEDMHLSAVVSEVNLVMIKLRF
ncbi:protein IQ-DOMAIN 31-like [Camellia sinensis]|uniref:protein IQ-DOMAIN 31-like n=1 Tax=Camellia sinensis TaxID=4442 RepID=UPI0010363A74|nr:protein IQ-DOMAIN 31-like [Camellia sinensis]